MKLIYLVLDGAADSLKHRPTPLEAAHKPGLDRLAENAKAGMHYSIGRGYAPESDAAVMSLLGYNPEEYYTGRGPLEALGAGIKIREEWEVAFRANFATIDPASRRIIDRRVARSLSSPEARLLAEALDSMELMGGEAYARVKATIGHRAVVVIGHRSRKLSANVDNTDPAYVRRGKVSVAVENPGPLLRKAIPLDESSEAELTASLVNEFTEKAIRILDEHPVNREREARGLLKANALLLRDAGNMLPHMPSIESIYGRKFAAIVEMPVERGIALAAGITPAEARLQGRKEELLGERLGSTLRLLENHDAVYVHLKGPDEPGHDGNYEAKKREIELIDKYYVEPLLRSIDLGVVAVLVTSDHATPWILKAHSDDPVPFMLASHKLKPDGLRGFSEAEALNKGSLGIVEHGWLLLPLVAGLIGWREKP